MAKFQSISNQGATTSNNPEKRGIYRTAFTAKVSVFEAGQFTTADGSIKEFKKGIKIKSAAMKEPALFSAREVIALYHLVQDDELLRDELRLRQNEEKGQDKDL